MGKITIVLEDTLLHDRLRTLSDEYSVTVELLVYIAVKRLLDDVELLRKLRMGEMKLE